jgi:hypothetical protein
MHAKLCLQEILQITGEIFYDNGIAVGWQGTVLQQLLSSSRSKSIHLRLVTILHYNETRHVGNFFIRRCLFLNGEQLSKI